MTRKHITVLAALLFLTAFVVAIQINSKLLLHKQKQVLEKHASVVASSLWNFDPEANKEYLEQVAVDNNYAYINVYSAYDDLFISIEKDPVQFVWDNILIKFSIIPSIMLSSNVIYDRENIGRIEVKWMPRTVYDYLNYFLVGLLLYALFCVWMSLVYTNRFLDQTVKERTKELAKTKSYLNNVVNSMPSVLIGVEPDGVITEVNKKATDMLGMEAEEIKGQTLDSFVPAFKEYLELIHDCIEKREPIEINKEHISLNGEQKIVNLVFYPLVTNGVSGAVVRLDDVGLKVRFDEMMVQSEKMLSVGGLAAGMAHEINNPLGAILQGIQNIKRRVDPNFDKNYEAADELGLDLLKVEQYLHKRGIDNFLNGITVAGERAAKIVANMLQFSRKSSSDRVDNDLHELIENTIELASNDYDLKKNFDFRHINIVKEYNDTTNVIAGVRTEIEQVLLNLLKNSAHSLSEKSTQGFEPQIIIRTSSTMNSLILEVEDNGKGIDERIRKSIFDPFFTTKPVGIGTGLGLSISYFIVVENHNGKIDIDSVPGKWTKVKLTFPVNKA